MKGLLYKDLLCIKKNILYVLIPLFVFFVIFAVNLKNSTAIYFIPLFVSFIVLINAFAYDEVSKWNHYALTLPITKKELVLSRYVLAALLACASLVIDVVFTTLQRQFSLEQFVVIYCYLAISVFLSAVLLPIVFQFGTQKSRVLILLLALLPMGVSLIFKQLGISFPAFQVSEITSEVLLWLSLPVSLILMFISYLISCAVVSRKEP